MSIRHVLGALLALGCLAFPASGQAPTGAAHEPLSLREMIDAAVTDVEVFADREAKDPARPLVGLRWANNARGSEDGMTLLYIAEGRPVAAACLYPWDGRLIHDFESLSPGRVVARQRGVVVWRPEKAGVVRAPLPNAPLPAETPGQRLRQMKSLAEQFQSSMLGWKADSSDREQLRLLPKPLYRYEVAEDRSGSGLLDGAVFAFVMGTDPESLLLIEAIGEGEKASWQFGFARRTSGELEGRFRDQVVWHADRYPTTNDPSLPHFSLGTPIPAGLLPGQPSQEASR